MMEFEKCMHKEVCILLANGTDACEDTATCEHFLAYPIKQKEDFFEVGQKSVLSIDEVLEVLKDGDEYAGIKMNEHGNWAIVNQYGREIIAGDNLAELKAKLQELKEEK